MEFAEEIGMTVKWPETILQHILNADQKIRSVRLMGILKVAFLEHPFAGIKQGSISDHDKFGCPRCCSILPPAQTLSVPEEDGEGTLPVSVRTQDWAVAVASSRSRAVREEFGLSWIRSLGQSWRGLERDYVVLASLIPNQWGSSSLSS